MYRFTSTKPFSLKAKLAAILMAACFCFGGTMGVAASSAATVPTTPEPRLQSTLSSSGFMITEAHSANETAIRFVRYTGLSKNLSLLLLHDVKEDAPIVGAINQYGMKMVQGAVVRAIKAVQNAHSIDWDQMLAGVYMQHFNTEELNSILMKREASPYFQRLLELQAIISDEIQENGSAIYKAARTEVMQRVSKDLPLS